MCLLIYGQTIAECVLIPVLVRNETYSTLGSPPSQPSPIKGEGVLSVDLIGIISNYKRYQSPEITVLAVPTLPAASSAFMAIVCSPSLSASVGNEKCSILESKI